MTKNRGKARKAFKALRDLSSRDIGFTQHPRHSNDWIAIGWRQAQTEIIQIMKEL